MRKPKILIILNIIRLDAKLIVLKIKREHYARQAKRMIRERRHEEKRS